MKRFCLSAVLAVFAVFAAAGAEFPVEGPWRVDFLTREWAPASITMHRLVAWKDAFDDSRKNNSACARYQSGKAAYNAKFVWRDLPSGSVKLELGRVCDQVLKVTLNGKALAVSSEAPFVAEARPALVEGVNELVVEVKSSDFNRKVYAAATHYQNYRKPGEEYPDPASPLVDNGLLGPVKFVYNR